MAYLVTGGTGFTGSYVVRDLLNAGKKVVCLQRSGVTPLFMDVVGKENVNKAKIVQGDVSNTTFLFNLIRDEGIEFIVHTAYALQPVSEQQPAYALKVNCGGMSNLLEAVRLLGLKRLVWVSSTRAFGRITEFYKEPMGDDDAFFLPEIFYGATKVLNEFMGRLYFRNFGTDSICFRVPVAYGFGKNGRGTASSSWFKEAALDKAVTVPSPDLTLAYLYVEDLSSLIVKACECPTTKTRTFNVQEGEYSNRQVAEIARRINPRASVTIGAGELSLFHRVQLPKIDVTGVQTELGWRPQHSLEEGLRKSFNMWRRQKGLPPL